MSRNKNVTFIEELEDLEEMEPSDMGKYGGSAIRTNQRVPETQFMQSFNQQIPYQYQPQYQSQGQAQPYQYQLGDAPSPTNCLSVADHIGNCPICSKLYSNDKTLYIIAIVILAIITILLLKKVLEL